MKSGNEVFTLSALATSGSACRKEKKMSLENGKPEKKKQKKLYDLDSAELVKVLAEIQAIKKDRTKKYREALKNQTKKEEEVKKALERKTSENIISMCGKMCTLQKNIESPTLIEIENYIAEHLARLENNIAKKQAEKKQAEQKQAQKQNQNFQNLSEQNRNQFQNSSEQNPYL